MADRFDLEQGIMQCWSIIEDIKALREEVSDKIYTQDFLENYLLGLEAIYQVKFEKQWDIFEKCVRTKEI